MYSTQEAAAIKEEFWTKLGQYLSPIPSANGEKINWINYKTGVKAVRFKMDALPKEAFVSVDILAEEELRLKLFHLFKKFKKQFPVGYEWAEYCEDEHGRVLSRLYIEKENISVFRKTDWPKLIQFFKTQVMAWDVFWQEHKDFFEMEASNYK